MHNVLIIYTNLQLNLPNKTILAAENDYSGNYQDSFIHCLTWIQSKRGIKCSKAGTFLAEHNFRFAIGNDDLQNRFMYAIASVNEHNCNESKEQYFDN